MYALTIFYDGCCPLCVREMRHLMQRDTQQRIQFVDLQSEAFQPFAARIDYQQANRVLHGLDQHGQLLLGLDVTHRAWSLVGRGYLTAPLRWPLIRWFADLGYRFFARHRSRIARLLNGEAECTHCALPSRSCRNRR